MATVTPNFNWPVPTSTDLVKDGATAIEALGDSIDASLVDLKGGTTGQVLSKTSGTDMDFTWVTSDDANAIQNTIVDAKGDLIAATAADTPARLAVGTNNQVLTADSTTATGLKWATPATAAGYENNAVINSAFQIWQRGTSFANPNNGYTADRWLGSAATAGTITRQTTSDTTNLPFIQYCLRYQRTAASTSTSALNINQSMETVNSIPLAGKAVVLSFYARAGANYSAASNGLNVQLLSGTGTDQNGYLTVYTGNAAAITQTATLTTTWQRFTYTGTLPSTATEIAITMGYTPVGTAGAADYYEITGVQLEVGSTATAFHTNSPTIEAELSACQRYYYRLTAPTLYASMGMGLAFSTSGALFQIPLPTQMRVAPTSLDFSTVRVTNTSSGWAATAMVLSTDINSQFIGGTQTTIGSASLTTGNAYFQQSNGSSNGYIGFNAEL